MPTEGSGDTSALRVEEPRRPTLRLTIAVLLAVGFLLLGVAVAGLVAGQLLVAAAFSGACLLLWLAAAVLQHTGRAQATTES